MMETGEIIYEKVYASPRPPKISFKDNWMKELGSEVAGGGKDSQQTQPKKLLEQGDLFCQSNNPVRVFRKSKTFLTWLRKPGVRADVTFETPDPSFLCPVLYFLLSHSISAVEFMVVQSNDRNSTRGTGRILCRRSSDRVFYSWCAPTIHCNKQSSRNSAPWALHL